MMNGIRHIAWAGGLLLALVGALDERSIQPIYAQGAEMGTWSSDPAPMPTARKEIANATVALGGMRQAAWLAPASICIAFRQHREASHAASSAFAEHHA